ncbi:MAG: AI-2E family transporter [Faecalibacterium prausnitzii]
MQFVENQFIYPRVVGKSVGLSPLYTLIAAMIGGKLFGIIGIIFFIPPDSGGHRACKERTPFGVCAQKSPCNKTACPEYHTP